MAKSQKGSAFERKLCKQLSLWWDQDSDDPDDFIFWRTSNSGGRATTRAKTGKRADKHCGDIGAVDKKGEDLLKVISFELKRGYNKATIHDLLDKPARGKRPIYAEWFEKAERDRKRAGALYWCLIHMRDRREALIFMPMELMNTLLGLDAMSGSAPHVCFSFDDKGVHICGTTLQAFLTGTKPSHILEVLRNSKVQSA